MTSYQFTGTTPLLYPQYLDTTGGQQKPLRASPGESYSIEAVTGWGEELAIPPGDGFWMASPAASDAKRGRKGGEKE